MGRTRGASRTSFRGWTVWQARAELDSTGISTTLGMRLPLGWAWHTKSLRRPSFEWVMGAASIWEFSDRTSGTPSPRRSRCLPLSWPKVLVKKYPRLLSRLDLRSLISRQFLPMDYFRYQARTAIRAHTLTRPLDKTLSFAYSRISVRQLNACQPSMPGMLRFSIKSRTRRRSM